MDQYEINIKYPSCNVKYFHNIEYKSIWHQRTNFPRKVQAGTNFPRKVQAGTNFHF